MFAQEVEVLGEDEATLTLSHLYFSASKSRGSSILPSTKESVRGGNRSRCHSLQDQRNSPSPWKMMQGPGSPITPVTLGMGCPAGARRTLRRGAHEGQSQLTRPREYPSQKLHPGRSLSRSVNHSRVLSHPRSLTLASFRLPAENWAVKKKGLYGVDQKDLIRLRHLGLDPVLPSRLG